MANPNLQLLTDAAKLLRPILGELVFVGGCATALLITDKAAADVRPTFDVDAIAEITSYAAYAEFSERLRKLGFQEDAREGAPLCRWRQQTTTLDVMPLDEKILEFSNMWYRPAMDHAEERELEKGLKIRLVAPVYFCASKLEAFAGKGKNDFHASRDLEDLIAVVDGRAELVGEIQAGGRGPIAQCEEQGSQPHNPVNHRLLLKKHSAIVGLESRVLESGPETTFREMT